MRNTIKMRKLKDYALILVKGMAMGAADVVPGVSGGTIALITGIYHELLDSLKRLGPETLLILFKEGIPACWKHINGNFLLAVFLGIIISIKTFAALIAQCLEHYPLLVWGFFSGLIIASVVLLGKQQSNWTIRHWGLCLVGVVFVYFVSIARPTQLPDSGWVLFLGGFVAICAMILPGISGSFILLLVGLYQIILRAVNELDITAIAFFLLGCISGLLVFSRFLSWLLDRAYAATLAVLIGFLVGSLNVTWPWKHVLETFENRHGELIPLVQKNVLPQTYESITSYDSQFFLVILSAFFGFFMVLLIEFFGSKIGRKNSKND